MATPEGNARDIFALQKDFNQLETVVGRIDMTLVKLTELESSISQILAVQESRLSNQERVADQLKSTMEDRRKENDSNFKDLQIKMDKLEQDIEEDAKSRHDSLMEQMKKNNEGPKHLVRELHARIDKIERWYFVTMGILIAIGVIIDKVDFTKIFG